MFKSKVSQNPYLAAGATTIHAIITVSTEAGEGAAPAPQTGTSLVMGFVIDCSGSMDGEKIQSAKSAVKAAISLLPEHAQFFVIAGDNATEVVSPLRYATPENKAKAKDKVGRVSGGGGTEMSTWLEAALALFPRGPEFIRQGLLLTDGANDVRDNERLPGVLAKCTGIFQCEARGVGADWEPDQLRLISNTLLGTTDIIPSPAQMSADFQSIITRSLAKNVSDAVIRLWTPAGASVEFCKQVSPDLLDLTSKAKVDPVNLQIREYPTGSWGKETRDYHFAIKVKPGNVGQKMLAGRASIVTRGPQGENETERAQVLAIWTDDEAQSAVIDRTVAHYTNQGELAQVIQEGLKARREGNEDEATKKLGRAVQLAAESGNEETAKLLSKVVDVIDESEGTVKLKRNTTAEDEMTLDTRSTKTRRITV